jgi:hypothetical protein
LLNVVKPSVFILIVVAQTPFQLLPYVTNNRFKVGRRIVC